MMKIKGLPKQVKAHFNALLKAGKRDEAWAYLKAYKRKISLG